MRVHELAKELNINSKELLEFLSSKNEKIKTSSNSVSEDEIALAKKQFVKKEQKPVTENKPEFKEAKEVKETKEQTKEQAKEESAQAPKQDAPVKKKSFPYITHKTADGRISGIHSVKIITGTETVMVPMTIEEMKNLLTGHRESVL